MKKMVRLFNKKKRSSVISYDVTPDAIPEGQRDIPRSFPKQTELYTNFRIDTCSSDLNGNNRESVNTNSQLAENGDEAPTEGTSETSSVAGSGSDTSISVPVERVESPSESASEESQLPFQQMGQTSSVSRNPPDSSKSIPLDRSDLSNVRALKELLKGVVDHDGCENKKHGNTYLIEISNSRHFHIGSKKTVNYPSVGDSNSSKEMKAKIMEITDLKSINLDESQKITDDRDFQKLTEDDVLQITLTVGERWREFARNLGTQESTIQELEDLNDKDYNVIVYEVLQQYLSRYPETTVGFMISVLEKSDETEAIRKLMRRDKRC